MHISKILVISGKVQNNIKYLTQDFLSVCLSMCLSCSGDIPWILKEVEIETSGQRIISLNSKTKNI